MIFTVMCYVSTLSLISGVLSVVVPHTGSAIDLPATETVTARPVPKGTGQFGEPHGSPFDDGTFASAHDARIYSIKMAGCGTGEHLSFLQTTFRQGTTIFSKEAIGRGTESGEPRLLQLDDNEHIVGIDITTYQAHTGVFHKSRRTRIGSIRFSTSKSQVLSCGSFLASDPAKSWHFDKHALWYLKGSAGDAIDALEAEFIPLADY